MKIILSQKLKLAELPYGYWLNKDGALIPVSLEDHFEVGQRILENQTGKRSSALYSEMYEKGWVRIVNSFDSESFTLDWRGNLTEAQKQTIKKLTFNQNPDTIEINNGIYYNLNSKSKINKFLNPILNNQNVKVVDSIRDKIDNNPMFFSSMQTLYSIKI